MNNNCINSFIESINETNAEYEIVIVESNESSEWNYNFKPLEVLKPKDQFNFHKFLNYGIEQASGDYYVLSNNDVVFEKKCFTEILKVVSVNNKIKSFSPYDRKSNKLPKQIINSNDFVLGYEIQKQLTGWCIVAHKSVLDSIGSLDERFDFYYADNDYAMTLIKHNIKHALVTKALAEHLEAGVSKKSKTPVSVEKKIPKYIIKENRNWILENEKMIDGVIKFHEKWGSYRIYKLKLKIALFLQRMNLGRLNRIVLFSNSNS